LLGRKIMETSESSGSTDAVPTDLLPLLRKSQILTDRQFEDVRAKVLSGVFPRDPKALADRLVAEQTLTRFQVDRLLRNKAHGFIIDRYVILERLGSGSKGRVFKAEHRMMGRLVALKVIAPHIASKASSIARFHREMRLVGRLDHPNVIRAFDADQFGEVLYLVMEYVPGRSLDFLLDERGALPPAEVVDYAAQAALGLDHAHSRGIVHRDVKPSNLLLDAGRRIKVLDLGLGILMEGDSRVSFATADGAAVGTVDYMSPEQACGRDLDGRSDLFGLGCTMYHLLTGRLPYPGEGVLERLGRRIAGRPVPITEVRPDLPPSLVGVLDKLLASRPEDRYQTGAEAAEALRGLLPHPASPAAPPGPERVGAHAPITAPTDFPPPVPVATSLSEKASPSVSVVTAVVALAALVAGCLLGYFARAITAP
jgi:serine/threonine-protein kinase